MKARAARAQQPRDRSLEGLYFLSFDQGKLQWQGQILGYVSDDLIRVQLYEWLMGEPSNLKIIAISDTKGWELFETVEEWRYLSERLLERQRRQS